MTSDEHETRTPVARDVLVTGATGYIAQRLIPLLLSRGHRVRALTRAGSVARVPVGAEPVIGNALSAADIASALTSNDTVVHLVGTPHPNPSKAAEFTRVDLASALAVTHACAQQRACHLVYVSVAHPAPMMRAYIAARTAGEQAIRDAQLTSTVLRPWYVLGPGHRWPYALVPLYAVASLVPRWRESAQRLGLVSLTQMVRALVHAVESPPPQRTQRVIDVPGIRAATL